jgi:ribosomal protein L32
MIDHVRHRHPVPYEDVTDYDDYHGYAKRLGVDLNMPTKMYRCPYCGKYLRDDRYYASGSMTTEMDHHQASHRDPSGTVPPLSFTVLNTVHEIEIAIQETLPPIRLCKECMTALLFDEAAWDTHQQHHVQQMVKRE